MSPFSLLAESSRTHFDVSWHNWSAGPRHQTINCGGHSGGQIWRLGGGIVLDPLVSSSF